MRIQEGVQMEANLWKLAASESDVLYHLYQKQKTNKQKRLTRISLPLRQTPPSRIASMTYFSLAEYKHHRALWLASCTPRPLKFGTRKMCSHCPRNEIKEAAGNRNASCTSRCFVHTVQLKVIHETQVKILNNGVF